MNFLVFRRARSTKSACEHLQIAQCLTARVRRLIEPHRLVAASTSIRGCSICPAIGYREVRAPAAAIYCWILLDQCSRCSRAIRRRHRRRCRSANRPFPVIPSPIVTWAVIWAVAICPTSLWCPARPMRAGKNSNSSNNNINSNKSIRRSDPRCSPSSMPLSSLSQSYRPIPRTRYGFQDRSVRLQRQRRCPSRLIIGRNVNKE